MLPSDKEVTETKNKITEYAKYWQLIRKDTRSVLNEASMLINELLGLRDEVRKLRNKIYNLEASLSSKEELAESRHKTIDKIWNLINEAS